MATLDRSQNIQSWISRNYNELDISNVRDAATHPFTGYKWVAAYSQETGAYSTYFSLKYKDRYKDMQSWFNALGFTMRPYPSCCGITMFYDFFYNPCLEGHSKLIDEIMVRLLKFHRTEAILCYDRRIELMMVTPEHSVIGFDEYDPDDEDFQYERDEEHNFKDYASPNKINYGEIFRYFNEQHTIAAANTFRNRNSSNLVHRLEVLLNL